MTIEYKAGRYFAIQWFVPGDGWDYLGALYRDEGADHWEIRQRFRYYASDSGSPHDGRDEKSWSTASIDKNEDDAIALFDRMVREAILPGCIDEGEASRIELRSADLKTIMPKIVGQSYSHVVPTSAGGKA